jgi:hypothetical protein
MSMELDYKLREARVLRDKLRAEGRNRDAEVLQSLIRGRESSAGLNRQLHRENAELRGVAP